MVTTFRLIIKPTEFPSFSTLPAEGQAAWYQLQKSHAAHGAHKQYIAPQNVLTFCSISSLDHR
jgi:hypothetical protein